MPADVPSPLPTRKVPNVHLGVLSHRASSAVSCRCGVSFQSTEEVVEDEILGDLHEGSRRVNLSRSTRRLRDLKDSVVMFGAMHKPTEELRAHPKCKRNLREAKPFTWDEQRRGLTGNSRTWSRV